MAMPVPSLGLLGLNRRHCCQHVSALTIADNHRQHRLITSHAIPCTRRLAVVRAAATTWSML